MLKALFALCALILALLSGILRPGQIGKLEIPTSPLMLGENFGERMWGERMEVITFKPNHNSRGETKTYLSSKNMQTLEDLESDIQDLRSIYDEELDLKKQIKEWDSKMERKNMEKIEKIEQLKADILERFQKSQTEFEALKIKTLKEKVKLDIKADKLKTRYEEHKMEQKKYDEEIESIQKQKKQHDMRLEKAEEQTKHLEEEKDRIIVLFIEEFEMEKIQEMMVPKTLESFHKIYNYEGINEIKENKQLTTEERMEKQIQILKVMKERFEYLKGNSSKKKRELTSQFARFTDQLERFEKSKDKEVSAVKILEEHIEFLKKFE